MSSSLPRVFSALVVVVPLAAALASACGGGSTGSGAGASGSGAASQGGSGNTGNVGNAGGMAGAGNAQAGGTGSGAGGAGGAGGDCGSPSDPLNCGACGHECAPGQTCEGGQCVCSVVEAPSFAADVQPILTASCAKTACHTGSLPKAGLDLSAGNAHGELVGVPSVQCDDRLLVVPGAPTESYLMNKVMNVDLCGTSKKMPPSGSLSDTQLQTLSDWICAGALDD